MASPIEIWGRLRSSLVRQAADIALPLPLLLGVSAALHLVVAVLAVNPWHPDEHFQILEPAWARAGLASMDQLPWEFQDRIRPTLQPTLALLALVSMRAVGLTSPFLWVLMLKLGTLALSMATVVWIASATSRSLDRAGRRALWLTSLERVDVLAQTLRIGSILNMYTNAMQIHQAQLEHVALRLSGRQVRDGSEKGAFIYGQEETGAIHEHANAWVTMFAAQALWLYDASQRDQTKYEFEFFI